MATWCRALRGVFAQYHCFANRFTYLSHILSRSLQDYTQFLHLANFKFPPVLASSDHHNYLTRNIAIARKIAHSIVLHVRVDHLQKMILNNILVTSLIPSPPLSQLESLSRKFFVQISFSFLLISCLDIIPLTLYWS